MDYYLEFVFSEMNVRYIAVNDNESTGLISGSPSCVSLRIIPERACSARSGEFRDCDRGQRLLASGLSRPFEKGRRKLLFLRHFLHSSKAGAVLAAPA